MNRKEFESFDEEKELDRIITDPARLYVTFMFNLEDGRYGTGSRFYKSPTDIRDETTILSIERDLLRRNPDWESVILLNWKPLRGY